MESVLMTVLVTRHSEKVAAHDVQRTLPGLTVHRLSSS